MACEICYITHFTSQSFFFFFTCEAFIAVIQSSSDVQAISSDMPNRMML